MRWMESLLVWLSNSLTTFVNTAPEVLCQRQITQAHCTDTCGARPVSDPQAWGQSATSTVLQSLAWARCSNQKANKAGCSSLYKRRHSSRGKKEKSQYYFKSFINLKQQEILNIIKLYQLLITNTYIVCRKQCRLNIGILSLCVKACKEQCKWKTLGIKKVFLVERKKKSKVKCTKQILQVHNNKNYSNIRTPCWKTKP